MVGSDEKQTGIDDSKSFPRGGLFYSDLGFSRIISYHRSFFTIRKTKN
jgi:hypothetical protein